MKNKISLISGLELLLLLVTSHVTFGGDSVKEILNQSRLGDVWFSVEINEDTMRTLPETLNEEQIKEWLEMGWLIPETAKTLKRQMGHAPSKCHLIYY